MPFGRLTLAGAKPKPYPENPQTLGDHLKRRRIELGLKHRDVASRLGVNVWTVHNWETGQTQPAVPYVPRIVAFLGYDPFTRDVLPARLGELAAPIEEAFYQAVTIQRLAGSDQSWRDLSVQTPAALDLTAIAEIAVTRILETGDVLGRDEQGRTVIALAVDDWMLDWFAAFGAEAEDLEPNESEAEDEV